MKRPTPFTCIAAAFIGLGLSIGAGGAAMAEVVVVVSAQSAVTTLSKNQVVDIFLGKTSRFPDGSIAVPIDQGEGIAAREEFYSGFASKSAAQLKAYWSKIIFTGRGQPPREASSATELKKLIVASPNSIGYIDRGLVDESERIVLLQ
jgi:ABC-type phosphate transport system substrate-binding protein